MPSSGQKAMITISADIKIHFYSRIYEFEYIYWYNFFYMNIERTHWHLYNVSRQNKLLFITVFMLYELR